MLKVNNLKQLEMILYGLVGVGVLIAILNVPYLDYIMLAMVGFAILLLVQNAELISGLSSDNPKVKTYKKMAIITFFVTIGIMLVSQYVSKNDVIDSKTMECYMVFGVSILMMLFGNYIPKIPHNRYMGYRLPWTIRDAEVWYKTHKLLGNLAFIIGIAQCVLVFFMDASKLLEYGIIIWILVPGIYSYVIYRKKVK